MMRFASGELAEERDQGGRQRHLHHSIDVAVSVAASLVFRPHPDPIMCKPSFGQRIFIAGFSHASYYSKTLGICAALRVPRLARAAVSLLSPGELAGADTTPSCKHSATREKPDQVVKRNRAWI